MNADDEAAKEWWNQEKKREKTGFIADGDGVVENPEFNDPIDVADKASREMEEDYRKNGYPCQVDGCKNRIAKNYIRCDSCRNAGRLVKHDGEDEELSLTVGRCVCGNNSLPYTKWCMPCFVRERDKNGLPALNAKTIYDAPFIHDGSYYGKEEKTKVSEEDEKLISSFPPGDTCGGCDIVNGRFCDSCYGKRKSKGKNMLAMSGCGDLATINKMIACVDVLYADDGREIHVQDWNPSVPMDGAVSVTCKGLIHAVDDQGEMFVVIPNSSSRHTLKKINICPVNMTSKDGREFSVLLTHGGKPPKNGEEWNPDHLRWYAPMIVNEGLVVNFTAVICMDQEKKD